MLDYENTFRHVTFTSVRDTYKTRELVNIIRSKTLVVKSCFTTKLKTHVGYI